MSKKLIDEMVNRFLCWKLPADFAPDCGISFKRESDYEHPEFGRHKFEPIGTNLLTADQARQMIEHMLDGLVGATLREDALVLITESMVTHDKVLRKGSEVFTFVGIDG